MRVEGSLEMLGNVCAVSRGTTITQKDAVEGPIPVVAGGLEPTYFHNRANRPPGIITVSGSGANAGYINYWPVPIFASDCSTVIPRDTEQLDVRYVFFALKSLQDFVSTELRHGAAQPHVYAKDIAQLRIFVPPISEQQRLVALLDEAFDSIAVAKTSAEQNLKNARALFDSHLETVFSRQGEGWNEKRVSEIALHSLGKMLDKAKNKGDARPYLRNINVRWFTFDLSDLLEMRFLPEEATKYTAVRGDVLICEGGYPGRAAIWNEDDPIYFQKALHRVRFHEPDYNKWFVYFLYSQDKSGELRRYFTGAGIQHFTGEVLGRLRLPVAPISETRRLVSEIEELAEETQRLEAIYKRKSAALEDLKKALLFQAFAGEL